MTDITLDAVKLTDDLGNEFIGTVTFDVEEVKVMLKRQGYKLTKAWKALIRKK